MDHRDTRPPIHVAKLFLVQFCLILAACDPSPTNSTRATGNGGANNDPPPVIKPTPPTAASGQSSILVKINPRHVPAGTPGDGSALVLLLDGSGNVISAFRGVVPSFPDLAIGVSGPRRDVRNGDTPFGVYRFTQTIGGEPENRLGAGYGTGKVYVDDRNMYGDVANAGRSLIRLHGGGSGLPDPYALDQSLRATQGCVRMKNRDVNTLIQHIKGRPRNEALKFIFMGSETYLNALATNKSLSGQPWWNTLRIALGIKQEPPTEMFAIESPGDSQSGAMQESDASLIESVKLFSEDVGPKGQEALEQLRSQKESLLRLQSGLPADDALQPQLAFALCYLGHECAANMQVVEAALEETSRFKGFYVDQAAQMVSRLIDKNAAEGNEPQARKLMLKLFTVAPKSDGALSEGLGVAYSEKLRDRTDLFVSAYTELFSPTLGQRSVGIRSKVHEMLGAADHLTPSDITTINEKVNAIDASSPTSKRAITEFRGAYILPEMRKPSRRRSLNR